MESISCVEQPVVGLIRRPTGRGTSKAHPGAE
jgi:hypothetical protein